MPSTPESRHYDAVIVVTGQSGSGKSTFINRILGKNTYPTNHTLACSTEMVEEIVDILDKKVLVLETPGFNNGELSDVGVIQKVYPRLEQILDSDTPIPCAIIFLHDVTDSRDPTKIDEAALRPFRREFTDVSLAGLLFLVTTKWDRAAQRSSVEEIEANINFIEERWASLEGMGAAVFRSDQEGVQKEIVQKVLESLFGNPATNATRDYLFRVKLDIREKPDPKKLLPARLARLFKDLKRTLSGGASKSGNRIRSSALTHLSRDKHRGSSPVQASAVAAEGAPPRGSFDDEDSVPGCYGKNPKSKSPQVRYNQNQATSSPSPAPRSPSALN